MLASAPAVGMLPINTASSGLERYERIIRNVEDCQLEGYQIVPTCPGMHELNAGIANVPADARAEVGRAMIGHVSPAVRVKAAELMNIAHGVGPSRESQDAIADAASHERDPGVLRAFIRVIADHGAANPKVATVLLAAAEHTDNAVRLQAVYALTSAKNRGLAGGAPKLAALAEKDSDAKVRTTACEYAGKLASDDLLPLYEKLTASPADPDLYAACMEGLVRMFHNVPVLDTHNERAYRLFLKRVAEAPANAPWSVLSTFCYFSQGSDLDKLAAWKQHAPWFDATEVKKVMASVVANPKASPAARSAAIESMVGLGASKPELEALRRAVDPKDKPALDKIVSAIAQ
jgi:HEAT repeats